MKKISTIEVEMGKDEFEKFIDPISKRMIRPKRVDEIYQSLVEAECPFVRGELGVWKDTSNRKLCVLDGNHRAEALRQFFEQFPTKKVRVAYKVYEGMTEDEAKKEILIINKQLKFTKEDHLKVQVYDSWLYKQLIENKEAKLQLPCDVDFYIKGRSNTISFVNLTEAYFQRESAGLSDLESIQLVQKVREANKEDYENIRRFLQDFVAVFGAPRKGADELNQYYLKPLIKAWWQSYQKYGPDYFRDRLASQTEYNKIVQNVKEFLVEYGRGLVTSRRIYFLFLDELNYKKKGDSRLIPLMSRAVEDEENDVDDMS